MGQSHEVCAALEYEQVGQAGFQFKVRKAQAGGLLFEVMGPYSFYWNGIACCEDRARINAYDAYQRHLKEELEQGLKQPPGDPGKEGQHGKKETRS